MSGVWGFCSIQCSLGIIYLSQSLCLSGLSSAYNRDLHGDGDGRNPAGNPQIWVQLLREHCRDGICCHGKAVGCVWKTCNHKVLRQIVTNFSMCWMTYKPSEVTWQPLAVNGLLFLLGLKS